MKFSRFMAVWAFAVAFTIFVPNISVAGAPLAAEGSGSDKGNEAEKSAAVQSMKLEAAEPDGGGIVRHAAAEMKPRKSKSDSGDLTECRVTVGKVTHVMTPDELGQFPEIAVGENQSVPVEVAFADGKPGEAVTVHALDGGSMAGENRGVIGRKLDDRGAAHFTVKTGAAAGYYRFLVMRGAETRTVQLVVSEPMELEYREVK